MLSKIRGMPNPNIALDVDIGQPYFELVPQDQLLPHRLRAHLVTNRDSR